VTEQRFDIAAAAGTAEGLLYTPAGEGPWPGILFYTDIFGIRPANQSVARRLAGEGFAVLMPNVFYRFRPLPLVQEGEDGKALLPQLFAALDGAMMEADAPLYVKALLDRPEVTGSRLGAVGYCWTGAMALRTAAVCPDRIAAAASFHGGHLVTDKPDSPHTRIPRVKAELYFGHAVEDQSATPAQVQKLDDALKGWGGVYGSEVYEGARHGWTVPGRDVYDEAQAERAFAKLTGLMHRKLD
jgi:carboxymethylenebutenolidase